MRAVFNYREFKTLRSRIAFCAQPRCPRAQESHFALNPADFALMIVVSALIPAVPAPKNRV